jgi:hypothetical protein
MIIGFTGTQKGMTSYQMSKCYKVLERHNPTEVHHGDCIGSDSQFHDIAMGLDIAIVIHPPINPAKRAFKEDYFRRHPAVDYLVRNNHIVNQCEILIATPETVEEELRSGTWATIRAARKADKVVIIIPPAHRMEDHYHIK